MQILANEGNSAAFLSNDPEPVAQLYAYVHYRLTSAHDGNTDQVSRKLNAGIEGTEGNHRVVAFRFGFLRNFCNQRTGGEGVDLRVGADEEGCFDNAEADLRSRRGAFEHSLPAPFSFLRRIFAHDDHNLHRLLLSCRSTLALDPERSLHLSSDQCNAAFYSRWFERLHSVKEGRTQCTISCSKAEGFMTGRVCRVSTAMSPWRAEKSLRSDELRAPQERRSMWMAWPWPGFIDPHTHLDAQLFWDPLGTSSCFHGVTSVVVGNCGLSLAPAKPEDREAVIKSFVRVEAISRRVLEEGFEWKWTSTKEYLDVLGTRLGINAAALVGHIAVRHYVMGEDAVEREATPEEIAQMQRLVRQGMESGAVGFSTNQNPRHMREDKKPVASRLASKEELGSLLDVLGEMNAGVVQLSGGGADARGRLGYAAELARLTGRPVLWQSISHSWSRPNHWQEMLDNTERVFREEGLPIYAMTQAKPFQNRYTLLDAQCFDEFPTWKAAMFNTVEERKKMLADPDVRKKLRAEAIEDRSPSVFPRRWDVIFVDHVKLSKNKALEGKSVEEVAKAQGKDGLDCFLDLSLEEDLETRFIHTNTQGDPQAV